MAAVLSSAILAYSLRIEYVLDAFADFPISERDILPNWSRDFRVSGKITLEQLSKIILDILGWDSLHLYEFRIHNQVYAHLVFLSEDDLFIDVQNPLPAKSSGQSLMLKSGSPRTTNTAWMD
ncbi:MAG: hypothetical protein HY645_03375 [Acidobacteria bacterium]|nr:hypothetical protein [Acidobacteriota bacterium]